MIIVTTFGMQLCSALKTDSALKVEQSIAALILFSVVLCPIAYLWGNKPSNYVLKSVAWVGGLFLFGLVVSLVLVATQGDNRTRYNQKKQEMTSNNQPSNIKGAVRGIANVRFNLTNKTSSKVSFKLFDRKSNLVWPSRDKVYVAPPQANPTKQDFKCMQGNVICYGAKATFQGYAGTTITRWGVDIDSPDNSAPEDACFVCGQKDEVAVSLISDKLNQNYKTSAPPPPPPPNKDKEYSDLLCDSWYVDRAIANGTKLSAEFKYSSEGSYKVKLKIDAGPNKQRTSIVLGTWEIINGFLIEKIHSSGEPNTFPVGQETSRIHLLNDKALVLEDIESKALITLKRKNGRL